MSRILKQLIYGLGFVIIVGAVGFWIYTATRSVATCFDKIQNQSEEGVDCGAVCGNECPPVLLPVEIKNSYLFKIREINGQTDHDALFQVANRNAQFGSSDVEYELNISDAQGISILKKNGSFYILPGQTKYIYEPLLKTKSLAAKAELKILSADWQKLEGVFSQDINLEIKSKEYLANSKPGVSSQVAGTIFNSSDFDIDRVDVIVVLYQNGSPIGANRTVIRTLLSKTSRFFEVDWTNQLPTPDRIDVEANTNVFENANFLRRYGDQERFQQFY